MDCHFRMQMYDILSFFQNKTPIFLKSALYFYSFTTKTSDK